LIDGDGFLFAGRPRSAVSISSSSDGVAEAAAACLGVSDGLGSISSITESVNSWSFRFPEMSSASSEVTDAADEKSTLLLDDRRKSALANEMCSLSMQSGHTAVRFPLLLCILQPVA